KSTQGELLGFKTIITPSKEKVKTHIKKVGEVIDKHNCTPQEALIKQLNPIIRGWSNYYSTVVSKETYSECDNIIYSQLKRWGERRHPMKSKTWVARKYWHTHGGNHWTFSTRSDKEGGMKLYRHAETPIVRHVKVKGNKSPFDGDLTYWASRMGKHPEVSTRVATLLKKQKGKCAHCGLTFRDGDLMEVDHIIPKGKGGKDTYSNLQLLHRHCHDDKTARDGSLNCARVKARISEKPCDAKVARTVLKTSQRGDSLT
ncbi:MAG: HNH endonuclease, partial [Gomphosphaeria aponina SAG 52.96 = DSM 107014]|nr:HNH endonuclease [Gomphosphaeria aponina SAG 52.96 = DSM 107014]